MAVSIRDRLQECNVLPTLPAAALLVLRQTREEEIEIAEISDTVSRDPALSARLLRVVNSSFYGLPQKVTSLEQAIALLGMHSVRMLVLGFSLVHSFRSQRSSGGFDHLTYWRRSMYAATAARIIAERTIPTHADNCLVAALLMDIGMLVLDQLVPGHYGNVVARADMHTSLMMIEAHDLGITHPEVGEALARHWSLPEELAVPIAHHHGPRDVEDPVHRQVTQVIWLAGRCADVFLSRQSAPESICDIRRALRELYHMDELKCDGMLCTIGRKTADLAHLFDVRLNSPIHYEQILTDASKRLLELSLAESDSPRNRRRAARLTRSGRIRVVPCYRGILGVPLLVQLRDVSASGLGLVHKDRIEIGTQFVIQLPQPDKSLKTLLYKVVRCETVGAVSSIGAELVSVLRPERVDPGKPLMALLRSAA